MVIAAPFFDGYNARAVNFDGSTYLRRNGSLSATSSKKCTLSFWVKQDAFGGSTRQVWWAEDASTNSLIQVSLGNSGSVAVVLGDTSGGIAAAFSATGVSASAWSHILISVDLTMSLTSAIAIDDVVKTVSISTQTNTSIGFANIADIYLGHDNSGGNANYAGDMAEMFLIVDQALNLNTESNRRKFITGTGRPASLSSDGSRPFGVQPELYFRGNATDFVTNAGDGGAFTETGTITTANGIVQV